MVGQGDDTLRPSGELHGVGECAFPGRVEDGVHGSEGPDGGDETRPYRRRSQFPGQVLVPRSHGADDLRSPGDRRLRRNHAHRTAPAEKQKRPSTLDLGIGRR